MHFAPMNSGHHPSKSGPGGQVYYYIKFLYAQNLQNVFILLIKVTVTW